MSAGLLGLSVMTFLSSYRPVFLPWASMASVLIPQHTVALAFLFMIWGLDTFVMSRERRHYAEMNEQETELFLQRLGRMLKARGSLAFALDDVVRSDVRIRLHSDPQRVLDELAEKWPTDAMKVVADSARLANRFGGALDNIIEHVIKHIALSRRWRFQRRLDEMALESTVLILAVAPYAILLLFAFALPEFYKVLTATALGHLVLGFISLSSFVVLQIFAAHIRSEGSL
ncbi:MAG: hypothetical protein M1294_09685 [Firmicutes bacterium]|nr:hypothetical protein [Bacillota bacterium]